MNRILSKVIAHFTVITVCAAMCMLAACATKSSSTAIASAGAAASGSGAASSGAGAGAPANDSLTTIDMPSGGHITYGPLTGQGNLQDAMIFMLKMIHGHFGDRPQIGQFFQARGTSSLATFFNLTAKNYGNKPLSGLVIVSMAPGTQPSAALMYDDTSHFGQSVSPMLKKLSEVWQADVAKGRQASNGGNVTPASAAPVPPLHQTTFADNSGSIGLPDGWKIDRARSGGVMAEGPKGETVILSLVRTMYDPTTPQGQRMIQSYSRGGRGMPFGTGIAPYGDLVRAYMALATQGNQSVNRPAPTLNIISNQKLQIPPNEGFGILIMGDLDVHDGKGPSTASIQITSGLHRDPSRWIMTVNQVSVPKALADAEWPTMNAIVASWRQNGQVIQAQTNQVIAQIHQIGANAKAQADAAHAQEDAHNASVQAHWDAMDKQSKNFQDYILDQSSVVDNKTGQRGTISNQSANLLVAADPNRFEIVPQQDWIKGRDY